MSRLFSGTSFDRPPTCDLCHKPKPDCRCLTLPEKKKMHSVARLDSGLILTPENSTPPKDQVATLRTEKRKGNRLVTLITGLDHPANDLPKLCTEFKATLGVGGSVQGRSIELQGDHARRAGELLQAKHFKTRVI